MTLLSFSRSMTVHLLFIGMIGCSVHKKAVQVSDVEVDMLMRVVYIHKHLKVFVDDEKNAYYEHKEIEAVARDLFAITKGSDEIEARNIDPVAYEKLIADWELLLGLDANLQHSGRI